MRKWVNFQLLVLTAVFSAYSAIASAQGTVARAGNVSKSATITAINQSTRVVTLKDEKGNVEDIRCGPEIARFNELKVGDVVTFSYHAAVVYQIAKAGAATTAAGADIVRGQGVKPSGAVTQQLKTTVTIESVDAAASSITVRTADGHSMTPRVQDKKNLEGLKAGDKVEITFTEALMVTVDAPKK
jgi:Cu/Ag efflux protein CusF